MRQLILHGLRLASLLSPNPYLRAEEKCLAREFQGYRLVSSITNNIFSYLNFLRTCSNSFRPTPQFQSLYLKSSAALDPFDSKNPAHYAVLCTHEKTYQVRQVHSSNSIYVLQKAKIESEGGERDPITPGVTSIAQCAATLELVPSSYSGSLLLRKVLPSYKGHTNREDEPVPDLEPSHWIDRKALLENVPLSIGEFDTAWRDICAFETIDVSGQVQAWIPSAGVLCAVWRSLGTVATLNRINLEEGFAIDSILGLIEEDGYPAGIVQAVVDRLKSPVEQAKGGWTSIDPNNCVSWLGANFLEAKSVSKRGLSTAKFLREWQDLIPEAWRNIATLDVLAGKYAVSADGSIKLADHISQVQAPTSSLDTAAGGKNSGRKWHERFKNTRR